MSLFHLTTGYVKSGCILDIPLMTKKEKGYLSANEILINNSNTRLFFNEKGDPFPEKKHAFPEKKPIFTVSFSETKDYKFTWSNNDPMFSIVVTEEKVTTSLFFAVITRKFCHRLCMFNAIDADVCPNVWTNDLENISQLDRSAVKDQLCARRRMMKNLLEFLVSKTKQFHDYAEEITTSYNETTNTKQPEVGTIIREFLVGV